MKPDSSSYSVLVEAVDVICHACHGAVVILIEQFCLAVAIYIKEGKMVFLHLPARQQFNRVTVGIDVVVVDVLQGLAVGLGRVCPQLLGGGGLWRYALGRGEAGGRAAGGGKGDCRPALGSAGGQGKRQGQGIGQGGQQPV